MRPSSMTALRALMLCGAAFTAALASAAGTLRLADGSALRGEIVASTDSTVTIATESLGRVTVKRSALASPEDVAREDAQRGTSPGQVDPDPLAHTLMLLPTAFLPPKGAVVFRDFELLFLTLGYSPTSTTSIVAGGMFPITKSFNALTMGVKQGLFARGNGAVAVAGNVTVPLGTEIDDARFLWLLNGIASYRVTSALGVHAAAGGVGLAGRGEGARGLSLGLGADLRVHRNAKLLAEVLHGGTSLDPTSSATLLNVGIRLHGDRLSADLSALRPLENMGDLVVLPMLNVGYRF